MFMQEWQDEKLISENLTDVRNDGKGGTARNLLIGLFILIIMLSLTWHMIFKDYSIKEMKAILLQADWRWLLGGFTLMLIHQCCIALSIIRVMNYIAPTLQVKFKVAFNTSFIGFFFNNITPSSSGGQPMQMYYLKKLSIPMSYTSVVFIALAIFYNLSMLFYCACVSVFRSGYLQENLGYVSYLLPLGYLLYIVTTTFLLLLFFNPKIIVAALRFVLGMLMRKKLIKNPRNLVRKLLHFSKRYIASSLSFNKNWRLLLELMALHLVQMAAYTAVPFFACMALRAGNTQNCWQLLEDSFSMQAVLNIAASLVPSPGAVGLTEGGFLQLFGNIVPDKQLIPALLLTRVINLYVFLLIAAVITTICFIRVDFKLNAANLNKLDQE